LIAEQLQALRALLATPQKISIVTHWSPDGDAIGSSLGLAQYFIKKGHTVSVVAPNEYPEFLYWMKGHDAVIDATHKPKEAEQAFREATLICCLDFNDLKRINALGDWVAASAAPKLLIDHHPQPSDFAAFMLHHVTASSTCELIFDFMVLMGDEALLDKDIAECLYTGIMTDTGSFRFPATTQHTHEVVGKLIGAGANHAQVHVRVYDDNSESRLRLLGFLLANRLKVHPESRTAYFVMSDADHHRFNYQKGDTEGVVNYALSIRGICFAAFFAERDGKVKCSFRSQGKFDVNQFSRTNFSGGGHVNAAGGASDESLEQTIARFEALLPQYKTALLES
jgi:bifunctional oligoribonuclease and PAP phosphatase NrnA